MPSTRLSVGHAIVVRPDTVTRLCGLLNDEVGDVRIRAECADGIERDFDSAAALNDYDNARVRAIKTLQISAARDFHTFTASVSLGSEALGHTFSMSAPDAELLLRVRSGVAELLQESRPWYWRAAAVDAVLLVLGGMGVLWLVATFGVALGLLPVGTTPQRDEAAETRFGARMSALLVLIFVVAGLLSAGQRKLFPKTVYAVGGGDERHKTLENVRWVVVVGTIVSVLGSVIASAF